MQSGRIPGGPPPGIEEGQPAELKRVQQIASLYGQGKQQEATNQIDQALVNGTLRDPKMLELASPEKHARV